VGHRLLTGFLPGTVDSAVQVELVVVYKLALAELRCMELTMTKQAGQQAIEHTDLEQNLLLVVPLEQMPFDCYPLFARV